MLTVFMIAARMVLSEEARDRELTQLLLLHVKGHAAGWVPGLPCEIQGNAAFPPRCSRIPRVAMEAI